MLGESKRFKDKQKDIAEFPVETQQAMLYHSFTMTEELMLKSTNLHNTEDFYRVFNFYIDVLADSHKKLKSYN